jgi:nucleotide-binding universal stress UspA family protein
MDVYKHLLIATDGSELAQKAVEQGLALAKALNAKVSAITVTPGWSSTFPGEATSAQNYNKIVAAEASKTLSKVDDAAKEAGVSCTTHHVIDRYPAEGINETANSRGCDLIVMASHGRRGLRRLMLGSQANEVVTQSTIPVLICR